MDRSKKLPDKRGKPKISITVLKDELKIKKEIAKKKESTLKYLKRQTANAVISESDLEEFDGLLSTDDEAESDGKNSWEYARIRTITYSMIHFLISDRNSRHV